MRNIDAADQSLGADLLRLEREQLLVLKLDSIEHLLTEPDGDPFVPRRGPNRSGFDDAALTLRAARRIPDNLTVRIVLPARTTPSIPTDQAQAALRGAATDQCSVDWREAKAVRTMGLRQLPIGITIAVVAAAVAYSAAAVALDNDSVVVRALLVTLAGLAITVAWMVSWTVVELAIYDWRDSAWRAEVYELLSRATLEVIVSENVIT